MSELSNIVFGVIKHECIAIEVAELDECGDETLKPGTMIQILPDHPGSECHFKILDFADWLDKYQTTIYKCSNNDCIVVTTELWPYLLAMEKNVERVQFVQKVNNQEFDMDLLKLGRRIRIRWPTGAKVKYGEFMVTHNGLVKELGKGYYIGLQLKNKSISLTPQLKSLSRHYRFGGTGIIVPADWIMLNIYKEETEIESLNMPQQGTSTSNNNSLGDIFELVKKIRETGAIPKIRDGSAQNQRDHIPNPAEHESNTVGSAMNIENSEDNLTDKTTVGDIDLIQLETFDTKLSEDRATSLVILVNSDTCPVCFEQFTERIVLQNCGDVFCKECLQRTITTQQSNGTVPKCPICTKLIEPDENTRAMFKTLEPVPNSELIECKICQKTAEPESGIVLANCGDALCQNCILSAVLEQFSNNLTPICPACHTQITSRDVLTLVLRSSADLMENRLDRHDLLEQVQVETNSNMALVETGRSNDSTIFQLNNQPLEEVCALAPAPLLPVEPRNMQSTSFQLNNQPFDCLSCNCNIDSNCGVDLINCGHSLCRDCISDVLLQQSENNVVAKCPVCLAQITDEEVSALAPAPAPRPAVELRNVEDTILQLNNQPFDCLICDCNIDSNCGVDLINCGHSLCRDCISETFLQQSAANQVAKCPLCSTQITDEEVSALAPAPSPRPAVELRNVEDTILQLNNQPFDCPICYCNIDSNCGVDLINCGHSLCRDCISEVFLQQSAANQVAKCPLCQTQITDEEVHALAPAPGISAEPRNVQSTSLHLSFDCPICDCNIESNCGVDLINCGHSWCRDCISEAFLQQSEANQVAKCPLCQTQITDEEVHALAPELHDIFLENRLDRAVSLNRELETRLQDRPITCTSCCANINYESAVDVENCGDLWCRNCITNVIQQQIAEGLVPHCVTCQMPFTDEEVITYGPGVFIEAEPEEEDRQNCNPAEICSICLEPCQQRVSLKNCHHPFCRECIKKWISEQQSEGNEPTCPVCRAPVELE